MTLMDKEGFRVVVNPCYGRNREKIANPPLLMGFHFLNDFTRIYDEQMGDGLKEKLMKYNNVWVDDQGGVKASRKICLGDELLLSYEGKRPPHKDKKPMKEGNATARATATAGITTAITGGTAIGTAKGKGTLRKITETDGAKGTHEEEDSNGPQQKKSRG